MANKHGYFSIIFMAAVFLLTGCDSTWNAPHPQADAGKKIIYSSFAERPKHLDPARSYSTDESRFIDQVYDAPLSYHYLKRPYELQPNTLTEIDRKSTRLNSSHVRISYAVFCLKKKMCIKGKQI